MAFVTVSKIVNELCKDENIIVEKTLFAQALDTPTAERVQWEVLYRMGANSTHSHFTALLENWVQRNGSRAQLRKLQGLLESCDFISASGELV